MDPKKLVIFFLIALLADATRPMTIHARRLSAKQEKFLQEMERILSSSDEEVHDDHQSGSHLSARLKQPIPPSGPSPQGNAKEFGSHLSARLMHPVPSGPSPEGNKAEFGAHLNARLMHPVPSGPSPEGNKAEFGAHLNARLMHPVPSGPSPEGN